MVLLITMASLALVTTQRIARARLLRSEFAYCASYLFSSHHVSFSIALIWLLSMCVCQSQHSDIVFEEVRLIDMCIHVMIRRWHCFNDRIVSDVDDVNIQSASAYLLFYVRSDMSAADVRHVFPPIPGAEACDITKLSSRQAASSSKMCSIM